MEYTQVGSILQRVCIAVHGRSTRENPGTEGVLPQWIERKLPPTSASERTAFFKTSGAFNGGNRWQRCAGDHRSATPHRAIALDSPQQVSPREIDKNFLGLDRWSVPPSKRPQTRTSSQAGMKA